MYDIVTEHMFVDTMMKVRPNNFSREGLFMLYEWLTEIEEGIGQEFDPIAICCSFTEWESIEEFKESYPSDENVIDWEDVQDLTSVIMLDDPRVRAITLDY